MTAAHPSAGAAPAAPHIGPEDGEPTPAHDRRREQLREGLACALISVAKLEKGLRPEASALACAVNAARERDTLEDADLGCGLLFQAGLQAPYDAGERTLHEGLIGALAAVAALARHQTPALEGLRSAVETALAEDVLDIDQVDTALARAACGEAFARRATEHAHEEARKGSRGNKRTETLPRKPRPWVEKHERERLEAWLGSDDPTPGARPAIGTEPALAETSEAIIAETHEAIEAAERAALRESDIGGGTNPAQAGARRAGEDQYTRRARLERLRWRLHDAEIVREHGREREAWQIAAATRHRVATAEEANERLRAQARETRIPPDAR